MRKSALNQAYQNYAHEKAQSMAHKAPIKKVYRVSEVVINNNLYFSVHKAEETPRQGYLSVSIKEAFILRNTLNLTHGKTVSRLSAELAENQMKKINQNF